MSTDPNNLDDLVTRFLHSEMRRNPPLDPSVLLNLFVNQIQEKGVDVSRWDEPTWRSALGEFGFEQEQVIDALENLAAWGVVDNFVWATPDEAEVEELLTPESS